MSPRRFKPYPAYKDSGVEWLGEIPAEWDVARADAFLSYEKLQIEPSEFTDELVFHYSIPSVQGTGDGALEPPSEIDSAKLRIVGKRLLVSKLNPRKGVVLIASEKDVPTVCSTEFVPFEVHGCDLRWAMYLFLAESTRQRLSAVVRSATRSHQRAEVSEIVKMWHGVPDIPEQRAIAAFLDRETARIDGLVAKKERLIELLQEQRTALITRAVTKGLDPSVPMKDSRVEWLGEIPAHWDVKPLKRLLGRCDYGISENLTSGGDIRVLTMAHIQNGEVVLPDQGSVNHVDGDLFLRHNDLVFNRTNSRELVAKVGLFRGSFDDRVTFASYLVRLAVQDRVNAKWLNYLLNSTGVLGVARSMALLSVNQANLNPTKYTQIALPCPTETEQRAIVAFLERKTTHIDALVAKIREAIDRLKEFRTALISAAVTGKIDVREEAA